MVEHQVAAIGAAIDVARFTQFAANVVGLPVTEFSVYYDRDADVVYVTFEPRQQVTDSEMRDDGILVRYCGDQVVALTILNASTR